MVKDSSDEVMFDSAGTKGVADYYDGSGFYVDIPLDILAWANTLAQLRVRFVAVPRTYAFRCCSSCHQQQSRGAVAIFRLIVMFHVCRLLFVSTAGLVSPFVFAAFLDLCTRLFPATCS